jgi:hypothetical protein
VEGNIVAKMLLEVPDDWKSAIEAEAGKATKVEEKTLLGWVRGVLERTLKKRGYELSKPRSRGRQPKPQPDKE